MQSTISTSENQQRILSYIATSPVAVPENPELKKETVETELARYEKIANLPLKKRFALCHSSIPQKIQSIGQKYGFELPRLANISRLIREYYLSALPFQNFPMEIERRMGVSLLTAQEITRYIKQEIIDWDPWAGYVAQLPKITVREMLEKHPKLAEQELTGGYVELLNSDDLLNPTIKNWVRDYVAHLGYGAHSQMQRTEYLFHSENGKNLSSPDREKLGIILRSFDENIALPVDEEGGEIVLDLMASGQRPAPAPVAAPKPQSTPAKQKSFIKPYPANTQPSVRKAPVQPLRQIPNPVAPLPLKPEPALKPVYQPAISSQSNTISTPAVHAWAAANPKIDKYFETPASSDVPPIRIQSITEHNEPRITPQAASRPMTVDQKPIQPQPVVIRPQHRIIDPFSKSMPEPRLDGNVVDLSNIE